MIVPLSDVTPTEHRDASPLLTGVRVIRERWMLVLAAIVICTGVVVAFSLTATKQYEATASVLVRPSNLTALIDPSAGTQNLDQQREQGTSLLLAQSTAVAQRVKTELHLTDAPTDLLGQISATSEPDANLINITAQDPDPRRAATLANAFASQFVSYRADADRNRIVQGEDLLRKQLSQLAPTATAERTELGQALQKVIALRAVTTGDAEVVDRATVPVAAASPRPKRDAVLGLLLGIVAGVAMAFLADLFDRRLKTVEGFEARYGLRALAAVPHQPRDPTTARERHAVLEPFRILRSSLGFLGLAREVRVIMVTSAVPGEGKSTIAVGLARAAALAGQRVVLVEADLRRPTFHQQFELGSDPRGLTTALMGAPVDELLRPVLDGSLHVLPSGPLPLNSAEILRSAEMVTVLQQLTDEADLVILDAPPLLPVADAQALLDLPPVDACLVVARAFRTTRDDVRRARAVLERHRLQNLGLVVNGLDEREASYTYYDTTDAGMPRLEQPSS